MTAAWAFNAYGVGIDAEAASARNGYDVSRRSAAAPAHNAYGISRNAASEPAAAAIRPASSTPNARPAVTSSARISSGVGSRPRAAALAYGAGYGSGLMPVDKSIHGSGARG